MLVSVVMPTYNSAAYVAESITSILQQSFSDLEVIVVDDKSTDGTLGVLNELASLDQRVRVISLNENCGSAIARNYGIRKANGRYIAFLDSDDLWLPNKLETQISFMIEFDIPFCCSGYTKINERGDSLNRDVIPPATMTYHDMLKSNQIGCLTAVYDTSFFGKVEMPNIRKRQDYALWLKLLRKTNCVHSIPIVLAKYRVRPNSISSNKIEMVKYNWHVYKTFEGMSISRCFYYLGWNILRKIKGKVSKR